MPGVASPLAGCRQCRAWLGGNNLQVGSHAVSVILGWASYKSWRLRLFLCELTKFVDEFDELLEDRVVMTDEQRGAHSFPQPPSRFF